ncbi:hypothetical protein B0I31_105146 [Saccharothrix carnea]|uniref:Uncharacterized protein n=1 Tax=Saccharothrix carnea TaxID=1280637 RepID=A0A2P8I9P5_SACCR|nr:hypothetical protein [Saccharothrix carnea]PSL55188.1 hypothetical protein B0I31_105146 [Saccharothrix carnea]
MRSFLVMGLAITGFTLILTGAFLIAYRSIKRVRVELVVPKIPPKAPGGGGGGGGDGGDGDGDDDRTQFLFGSGRQAFNPLTYAEPISKLRSGDRLIAWGLVLLVLACLVSGFLDVSVGELATAGE